MKPSEWIEKLEDKDVSKEPFLAMSEEEAKKLDERFIDREEYEEVFRMMKIIKKRMPDRSYYLIEEEAWKKFVKKLGLE